MFCDGCGTSVDPAQKFCPNCGKSLAPVPLMQAPRMQVPANRIAGHLRLLGILWLVVSALRLIPGLFLEAIFRPESQFLPPEVPPFVPHLVQLIGLGFVAVAILGGITGWGLLTRQPWARMAAIVFGVVSLLDVPFGTALGIYTLWVLLPGRSEEDYRQTAQAA